MPLTATQELVAAMAITLASHATGIPFLCVVVKRRRYFEFVLAVITVTFSLLYHVTELLAARWLGMSCGDWHRLDNVFALTAVCCLFVYLMDTGHDKADECLRLALMALILFLQQQDPWAPLNSSLPLGVAILLCLGRYLHRRRLPGFLHQAAFWKGVLALVAGAVFFVLGLDDQHDYLRWQHSTWHICVFYAFYSLFRITFDAPTSGPLPDSVAGAYQPYASLDDDTVARELKAAGDCTVAPPTVP
eukprot:EG_transcript_22100